MLQHFLHGGAAAAASFTALSAEAAVLQLLLLFGGISLVIDCGPAMASVPSGAARNDIKLVAANIAVFVAAAAGF